MCRKSVLLLTFTLLVGILGVSFEVGKVKGAGWIVINADGSIDPPTVPIVTTDNVTYTFTVTLMVVS